MPFTHSSSSDSSLSVKCRIILPRRSLGARNNQITTTVSGKFSFSFVFYFYFLFLPCRNASYNVVVANLSPFVHLPFHKILLFAYLFNCDFDGRKGISVGSSKRMQQMHFVQLITLNFLQANQQVLFFLQITYKKGFYHIWSLNLYFKDLVVVSKKAVFLGLFSVQLVPHLYLSLTTNLHSVLSALVISLFQ